MATTSTKEITPQTAARPSSLIWLLTVGGFYAFFVFGFIDNLKGPTLGPLMRDQQLSDSQGGLILFAAYIGFIVATLLAGILADAIGNKGVLLLAAVCLTVGLAAFSLVSTFGLLALAFLVVGLGLGCIEVGGNALIVDLHSHAPGRFLNLLAVFHGVGSFLVPLYAALMLNSGFSWRQVFQISIVATAGMVILFALVKAPHIAVTEEKRFNLAGLFAAGFTRRMTWYYLMITAYVAAEIGIAAWIVEFLQRVKGFSVGASSLYLSLFFAAIMIGRLVGSLIVERIGYLTALLAAAVAAIVCLTIGLVGPTQLTILVPLTGLFFSIIFPTTTASVASLHVENTGAILGVLFAFGGLGGALGPWIIGVASDLVGISLAFGVNIVFCAIVLVGVLVLRRMQVGIR